MGSSPERFHVRWNEYESSIKHEFSLFRQNGDFFDVTLACGSERIKAHKIILSAFSPLFCSIIKSVPVHEHPLIYLRGIKFHHLESLLQFMYHGEVSLTQEDFEEFLSTAFELEVRGLIQDSAKSNHLTLKGGPEVKPLTESSSGAKRSSSTSFPLPPHFLTSSSQIHSDEDEPSPTDKKRRKRKVTKTDEDASEGDQKVICEPEPNISIEEGDAEGDVIHFGASSEQDEDLDMDFEYYRQHKVATEDIGVVCMICNKVIRQSYNLSRHFEAYHSNSKTVYECPKCRTRHRTKSGFQGHISKFHKLWRKQNVEMYSVTSSS